MGTSGSVELIALMIASESFTSMYGNNGIPRICIVSCRCTSRMTRALRLRSMRRINRWRAVISNHWRAIGCSASKAMNSQMTWNGSTFGRGSARARVLLLAGRVRDEQCALSGAHEAPFVGYFHAHDG